jgi:hypothetical protein
MKRGMSQRDRVNRHELGKRQWAKNPGNAGQCDGFIVKANERPGV